MKRRILRKNRNNVLFLFSLLGLVLIALLILSPEGMSTENVSETRVIPAGSYIVYSFEMQEGDIINVDFEVIAGDNLEINFYVVDAYNYAHLIIASSFLSQIRLLGVSKSNFQFEAQTNDTYYAVFSNTFSPIASKTVEIEIEYVQDSILDGILIIIILGVGISIAGFVTIKNQAKKALFVANFRHNMRINAPSDKQDRFCTACGQSLEEGTHFCSKCGKKR
ncbi:MAG: emp24/gp25L/p24 family protein [Promethearchaeota archaeon]